MRSEECVKVPNGHIAGEKLRFNFNHTDEETISKFGVLYLSLLIRPLTDCGKLLIYVIIRGGQPSQTTTLLVARIDEVCCVF